MSYVGSRKDRTLLRGDIEQSLGRGRGAARGERRGGEEGRKAGWGRGAAGSVGPADVEARFNPSAGPGLGDASGQQGRIRGQGAAKAAYLPWLAPRDTPLLPRDPRAYGFVTRTADWVSRPRSNFTRHLD